MVDARSKHKPNEKHTLDEVLKSLNDLVRNQVLDQPSPPSPQPSAAAPKPKSAPSPASATDMRDILSSLEGLLTNDLRLDDKSPLAPTPAAPVAAVTARATTPAPAPTRPSPAVAKKSRPDAAAETKSEPARKHAPAKTKETPRLDIVANDVAQVLEPSRKNPPTETTARKKAVQQELSLALDDAPLTSAATPAADEDDIPVIEVDETPLSAEEEAMFMGDVAQSEPTAEANTGEIIAAPPPELATDTADVNLDADLRVEMSGPAEAIAVEAAPAPEAVDTEPELELDDTLTLTTPRPKREKAQAAQALEDLTPPLPELEVESDITIDRSAPPVPEDLASEEEIVAESVDNGLTLGGVIELGVSETVAEEPKSTLTLALVEDLPLDAPAKKLKSAPRKPVAETPTVVLEAGTAPVVDDIPVLQDVALAAPAAKAAPALQPPEHLREMAVKIVAKLNIEMRKSGKPPLDAKTILRLQQLMREALEQPGESEKSKLKS